MTTESGAARATVPSQNLLANLRAELMRTPPFQLMEPQHVDRFIAAAEEVYYAPDETLLSPASGVVEHLLCVRRGAVTGRKGFAEMSGGYLYEAGDLFPVGAVMGARAVTSTYKSSQDTFCLRVPAAEVKALAAESPPLADFLGRRVMKFLELSSQALQSAWASQTLAEQSLEAPLATVMRRAPVAGRAPVTVTPEAPLSHALRLMHDHRVGSIIVLDGQGAALGILTRIDVLGRVTLPQVPLSTPIERVMTSPVHTLSVVDTAQDAALLMSKHGIRHVPVTYAGRVVGVVSERDLFAMQRLSLRQVSTALRAAPDVETLRRESRDIRRFAGNLLGQGVRARQLTELISHLNDVLTERLVQLLAGQHGLDMQQACWIAFGSEGRREQTIATDQDNGLVFLSDDAERDRPAWLALAREVNAALDACGYPVCKGNVMASNPACCLTPDEWLARFAHWMEHGAPEDLLNASIFFDFRPLVGRADLTLAMRSFVTERAVRLPRFIKQLATNALRFRPPLNWLGGVETRKVEGRETLDLKMQGTAPFVDVARIYALAHGIEATGTRARFQAIGHALGVEPQESEGWISGFEFLQMLRLQVQLRRERREAVRTPDGNPNLIDFDELNDIDRRVVKEALRVARRLQQRMELDYMR
jgi:CBS domain-containing protein